MSLPTFPWLTKAMFGGMNPYGALAMSLGPALLGRRPAGDERRLVPR